MQDFQMHPKGTFLCSFDIRSLFTNVPLAETIQICADSLYVGELRTLDYPKEIFVELMNTATKSENPLLLDSTFVGIRLGLQNVKPN